MNLNIQDQANIEKEIKDIISKQARSVDQASDTTLASQIWFKSPEASFIHPRGHEHGWKEIKKNLYEDTMGNRFFERKLQIHDISVKVFGETAFAEIYWNFVAPFNEG